MEQCQGLVKSLVFQEFWKFWKSYWVSLPLSFIDMATMVKWFSLAVLRINCNRWFDGKINSVFRNSVTFFIFLQKVVLIWILFQNGDNHRLGINPENLGNGTIVGFTVISSVLLVAYVIDGRGEIMKFFLEWVCTTIPYVPQCGNYGILLSHFLMNITWKQLFYKTIVNLL